VSARRDERPSLRGFLTEREQSGRLQRIKKVVEPRFELAALLAVLDGGDPVVFDSVAGSAWPAVGNVLASLSSVSAALGVPVTGIQDALVHAIGSPQPPVVVASGECQDVVEDEPDFGRLPVPTFFEHETGPYITAGVVLAHDPLTGARNASFARLKILGPRSAMIGIAPNHHLARLARARPDGCLDVAVAIGVHPAVALAACLYLGLGDDELTRVGALLGEPLDVVAARTVDVLVPASAEFVLEGVIDSGRSIREGLVSEFHGYYEDYGSGSAFELGAVTHRRDALFQVVLPGYHREHIYLGALAIAAGLRRDLRDSVPTVVEIAVVEAGAGRLAAVVALAPGRAGQARRAMTAIWASVSLIKQVTVVDAGVDVWDAVAVERARINCCRVERDVLVVPGMSADRSEPQEDAGLVAKIGYDATSKTSDRAEGFTPALPPAPTMAAARDYLDSLSTPSNDQEYLP
jgi:4-hydroxy-3-polyprenylbenzoate decarboxylase